MLTFRGIAQSPDWKAGGPAPFSVGQPARGDLLEVTAVVHVAEMASVVVLATLANVVTEAVPVVVEVSDVVVALEVLVVMIVAVAVLELESML